MSRDRAPQGLSRRSALKMTGAATAGMMLAGCSGGGGGGDGDSEGGGGESGTASGDSQPSYEASVPEVNLELGTMPHMAAVRDIMPSNTDGRMTGSVERFDNIRLQITALNAGSIDTYTNAPANLYFAQAAGNDYRIIAPKVMGTDYYIVGHEEKAPTLESFVERPDELTFAINQVGNIDHLQVVGVYDQEGLDFGQASTVNVGGSSARISAFLSGRAQGFTLHIEQFERLKSQGEPVKLLADVAEYYPNFVQECIAVPAQSLEDPTFEAWVQEYVNAVIQANQRANNDFDWVFNKAQQYQAQPLERETARSTWEIHVEEMEAWNYQEFPKGPFQSVYDMLSNSGQLEQDVNIDQMFEPKYAQNAIDNM